MKRALGLLLAAALAAPAAQAAPPTFADALAALFSAAAGAGPEGEARSLLACAIRPGCNPPVAIAGLYEGTATIVRLTCYKPGEGFATAFEGEIGAEGGDATLSIGVPGLPPFAWRGTDYVFDEATGALSLGVTRVRYPAILCEYFFDLAPAFVVDPETGAFDGEIAGGGFWNYPENPYCVPFFTPAYCEIRVAVHGERVP